MDDERLRGLLDDILFAIVEEWYQRVKSNYVTEEDGGRLGIEPEIKRFHDDAHRIKFARKNELDVTYGLRASFRSDGSGIESSVNNKTDGFDYRAFVARLQDHYWSSRIEKPWVEQPFDRSTYQDLLSFEPRLGETVLVESREQKADIIRLIFQLNERAAHLLDDRPDLFRDLVENYCLAPMKRLYAECLR